ncbi:Phox homologous domain-containing protein [Sordaria brevicollis]|uniref:Endosomal/vacuolar adapter protein YPT35 n=1 Tax=Sordaria brevicollis TaxID=83679 RepID=A0AAE0PDN9_SORBR|nr:Phox homologous domain-containing protein [Sordaria brevicollis]
MEAQHPHHQEDQDELSPNGDISNGHGGEGAIEVENELPSLRPTTPTTTSKPTTTSGRPPQESSDNEDDALGTSSAEDGFSQDDHGSELVTSPPSVTSPPYWAHGHDHTRGGRGGGTRHARTMSSVSAESDLPPGAITLQDNEHDDGPDGANVYGRDRNRACWAKKVDIVDYILVNGGTANIGAFVVWNIRVETLNGSRMNIRKRYSEFDGLRKRLVQTFPNFEAAVPPLPPKSILHRFQPKFLEKRRAGLQYFLNCILLNPEFSGSPVLKEFLFS